MDMQQEAELLAKIVAAFPKMKRKAQVAAVVFCETSLAEDPKRKPRLSLIATAERLCQGVTESVTP